MVIGCCSDEEDHEELEIDVEDDVEEDLGAAAGGQEEGESSFSTSSPSFSSSSPSSPTSLPVDPATTRGKRKADKTTMRTGYTSAQLKEMNAAGSAFKKKSSLDATLDGLQSSISQDFSVMEFMMMQNADDKRKREEREEREDRRREEREREMERRREERLSYYYNN